VVTSRCIMMTVTSGRLIKVVALSTATKTTTVMSSRKANRDLMEEGLDHQGLTLLDLAHGKKAGLNMKEAEVQQHGSVTINKTSKWPNRTASQAETTEEVLEVIVPVAVSTAVRMGTWHVNVHNLRLTGDALQIKEKTEVATSVNVSIIIPHCESMPMVVTISRRMVVGKTTTTMASGVINSMLTLQSKRLRAAGTTTRDIEQIMNENAAY